MRQYLARLLHAVMMLPHAWRAHKEYVDLMESMARAQMDAMVAECRSLDLGEHELTKKYLNYRVYFRENIIRCLMMGIHSKGTLRVLDLGCGAGYFMICARHFGHETKGLDVGDNVIYDRFVEFFSLDRVCDKILPEKEIKVGDGLFDLITAFSVTFNTKGAKWGYREWAFYMDDIHSKLADGGELYMRFNCPVGEALNVGSLGLEGRFRRLASDYRTLRLRKRMDRATVMP
jgi:SAM-dependent methyltransferase